MAGGRLFQTRGLATANALSPRALTLRARNVQHNAGGSPWTRTTAAGKTEVVGQIASCLKAIERSQVWISTHDTRNDFKRLVHTLLSSASLSQDYYSTVKRCSVIFLRFISTPSLLVTTGSKSPSSRLLYCYRPTDRSTFLILRQFHCSK